MRRSEEGRGVMLECPGLGGRGARAGKGLRGGARYLRPMVGMAFGRAWKSIIKMQEPGSKQAAWVDSLYFPRQGRPQTEREEPQGAEF